MNDEFIKLDTTIIAIDKLINEAATGSMARTLLTAKDTIYNQQRYIENIQPVKRGKWISKENAILTSECSLCKRSVSMLEAKFYKFCPYCGARMCGKTKYKPIKALEDIKTICSERQYCQDTEKGTCQFYDKNSGYCIFDDMPEDWNIEENEEILKEMELEKNASKI